MKKQQGSAQELTERYIATFYRYCFNKKITMEDSVISAKKVLLTAMVLVITEFLKREGRDKALQHLPDYMESRIDEFVKSIFDEFDNLDNQ